MDFENAKLRNFPVLYRNIPETLQINLGKKCNQQCEHCHVDAGPDKKEDMSEIVANKIISVAQKRRFSIADITGGAPELNDQFSSLVENLTKVCEKVIVRSNLTVAYS